MTAIRYRLGMSEPQTHLLEVEVRLPALGASIELVMPSWTPGSYLLREFARNVQDFRAETADGRPVVWTKTDKNTWRLQPEQAVEITVRYRVYANELTVRTSHLDATHAYVNGASVFMFVRGREREPIELRVDAPPGWTSTTALPRADAGVFRCADYDHLVDSPLEIGRHQLLGWGQSGVPHQFAVWGSGNLDADRLLRDTRRIVAACERLFGGLPYPSYTFLLHLLPDGRGGLEHRDSCSLQADRWAFQGEPYENFIALVAHEFFHVWNGKRIRPASLGPFDYTAENYTRNLWVVEGLTTYYTELILRRAGLVTPERLLARLAEMISRLQLLPGRRHQSLAESSFDTWIRFYRPDEHTPNAQISYYQKGAIVGFLLDLEIRGRTGNRKSLDDLMRLLWERYGKHDEGYPEEGEGSVEALAAEVAGEDLSAFFDAYVRGTTELDYARHLSLAGLALAHEHVSSPARAGDPPTVRRAPDSAVIESRMGLRVREQGGRVRITTVLIGEPGSAAGVEAGDEIVALNGYRISSSGELASRMWERPPGQEAVSLSVFRRDELRTLELVLGAPPLPKLRLVPSTTLTDLQKEILQGWSTGPEPSAGGG